MTRHHSLVVGIKGMRFEEVEEHRRGGRQRTAAVKDEVEVAREVKALDGDRSQLRAELPSDGQLREESNPEAPAHGILDGRVAAELEGDTKGRERGAGPRNALLRGPPRTRSRLADDEHLAFQGCERDGFSYDQGMPRMDDQHEAIRPDRAIFEVGILNFLSDEPKCRPALLDILQHQTAVAHRRSDMHSGMFRVKGREQGREAAFSRHRAGCNRQVSRDGRMKAADVSASLLVQVEDLTSVLVEPLTGLSEGDPAGPTVEQRDAKLLFEAGDSLAHRRLSDAELRCSGREAPLLRSPRERREVWKLGETRGEQGFDHRWTIKADQTRVLQPLIGSKMFPSAALIECGFDAGPLLPVRRVLVRPAGRAWLGSSGERTVIGGLPARSQRWGVKEPVRER